MRSLLLLALLSHRAASLALPDAARPAPLLPYEFSEPPQLHPLKEEHVVDVVHNGSFAVRCAGRRPVEWSLPEDQEAVQGAEPLSLRAEVTEEEIPGENPRPFLSHLKIEPLHFLDTGR